MYKYLKDVSELPFVPSWIVVEEKIEQYGWEDNKDYYRGRLNWILEQLSKKYDIELAREKEALYFINSCHMEFMGGGLNCEE